MRDGRGVGGRRWDWRIDGRSRVGRSRKILRSDVRRKGEIGRDQGPERCIVGVRDLQRGKEGRGEEPKTRDR